MGLRNISFCAALVACLLSLVINVAAGDASTNFVVKVGNKTCFHLQAELGVSLSFNHSNHTESRTEVVPQLNATGQCKEDLVSMTLKWTSHNDSYVMTLNAKKNNTVKGHTFYDLSMIKVDYHVSVPGANNTTVIVNGTGTTTKDMEAFQTNLDQYYACDKRSSFAMTNNVTASMSNIKFQAFSNRSSPDFTGKEDNCEPPPKPTSALVPIIVGAALGGMILLVLIGYCIGRRRNRSGYTEIES